MQTLCSAVSRAKLIFWAPCISKMAASFTVEEVLDQVLNSDDENEEMIENRDRKEEDIVDSAIESWLHCFPAKEGFNRELFEDIGKELMKPLVLQCSVSCNDGELQSTERSKATTFLCSTMLNAASVLRQESLLWMQRINSRIGGRVAFRRPYTGSISRSIPYDVFKVARRVISENRDGSFYEPRCYIKRNNKAEVICFTSLYSLQKFFSTISALSINEVKQYFSRHLKSRGREDHVVKLLVDDDKQLAFTYFIKKGQLTITFQYGEWNTANYPFHNCEFDPDTL